ncbi:MAG: sugar ABC transporter permease [Protaetiibacter sp.]
MTIQRIRPPRRRVGEGVAGYAFLLPWLLGFLLLTAGPMLASAYLAFTDYNLFRAPQWVGLDNFERMLGDDNYHQAWRVTLLYVLVGAPLKLAAALAVAVLLNRVTRTRSFYSSAFYLPSLVGASVSIAIVWKAMFIEGGVVDQAGSLIGITGGWVGDPSRTLPMLVLLSVWQLGAPMVIFLAGIKQVPPELLEAAALDGAGPVRTFFRVTLPMITPVLFFNLLLEIINSFQIFGSAYIISNGTGGPARSTLFYTLYLYVRGFQDFQMGYASAMAWVFVLVIGGITAIMFRSSSRWVYYSGGR